MRQGEPSRPRETRPAPERAGSGGEWQRQTWTRSSPRPRGCVDATVTPHRRTHSSRARGSAPPLRLSRPAARHRLGDHPSAPLGRRDSQTSRRRCPGEVRSSSLVASADQHADVSIGAERFGWRLRPSEEPGAASTRSLDDKSDSVASDLHRFQTSATCLSSSRSSRARTHEWACFTSRGVPASASRAGCRCGRGLNGPSQQEPQAELPAPGLIDGRRARHARRTKRFMCRGPWAAPGAVSPRREAGRKPTCARRRHCRLRPNRRSRGRTRCRTIPEPPEPEPSPPHR
jgi:hypothetical protein